LEGRGKEVREGRKRLGKGREEMAVDKVWGNECLCLIPTLIKVNSTDGVHDPQR